MHEVEFTIDPATGEITMHIKGVAGPTCDDIAARVKELLGEPVHEWKTPEYYLRPQTRTQIRPKRGR